MFDFNKIVTCPRYGKYLTHHQQTQLTTLTPSLFQQYPSNVTIADPLRKYLDHQVLDYYLLLSKYQMNHLICSKCKHYKKHAIPLVILDYSMYNRYRFSFNFEQDDVTNTISFILKICQKQDISFKKCRFHWSSNRWVSKEFVVEQYVNTTATGDKQLVITTVVCMIMSAKPTT